MSRVIPIRAVSAAHQAITGERSSGLLAPPPLALYIHWPWCVRKCPYCDFNSHELRSEIDEMVYVDALIADLEASLPRIWNRPVISIFIGGGTPSLMSALAMERLLSAIRARVPLWPDVEITLEANPGAVDRERFAAFRDAGVNRLSLGIQSFNDRYLHALGRIHDGREAWQAIDLAQASFERVNVDLMYALPGQRMEEMIEDIGMVMTSGVSHVSAYQLTIEPNTAFHHHAPPGLPDEDDAMDMTEAIEEAFASAGFNHYETSAFADQGEECRHNLNYWTFGDYLGIGAGAHGKLSDHQAIRRETRPRHPKEYVERALSGKGVDPPVEVVPRERPAEFMMNALRLVNGFEPGLFAERTGLPLECIASQLDALDAEGLLEVSPRLIKPSVLGRKFVNVLVGRFLEMDDIPGAPGN